MVYDPSGKTLFILCPSDIKIYDETDSSLIGTIPLAEPASSISLSKDVSRLFLSHPDSHDLLTVEKIRELDQGLGLDMSRFDTDIQNPKILADIDQDLALAGQIKIKGVPSIYINGKFVKNRSFEGMARMIQRELEKTIEKEQSGLDSDCV